MIHLQQSDDGADHHWPFTGEINRIERIDAGRVLEALDASGAEEVVLVLEVIPPFEASDEWVLEGSEDSLEYSQRALNEKTSGYL